MNKYHEELSDIIETRDLYGRSFTLGVALYMGAKDGMLSDELESDFEILCESWYSEVASVLEQNGMHHGTREWAEILDLSVLDEMARELIGENEEDEE